jgi:hypothetical protein
VPAPLSHAGREQKMIDTILAGGDPHQLTVDELAADWSAAAGSVGSAVARTTPRGLPSRRHRGVSKGSRLVPYVGGRKRGLQGVPALSLTCTNTVEVQVNLDGRIHPKPAPHVDAWP